MSIQNKCPDLFSAYLNQVGEKTMTFQEEVEIENEIYNMADEAYEHFAAFLRVVGKMERKFPGSGEALLEEKIEEDIYVDGDGINLSVLLQKAVDLSKICSWYGLPLPRAEGFSYNNDDSSGYVWALFHVDDLPSYFDLEDRDLDYRLTGWYCHAHGVGRSFSSVPTLRKVGKRILVKQYRGLDI